MRKADLPTDEELIRQINATTWRRSPGYRRADDFWVEPHEYILLDAHGPLFEILFCRIQTATDCHFGHYGGRKYRYVDLDGWTYWTFARVLNRRRISTKEEG